MLHSASVSQHGCCQATYMSRVHSIKDTAIITKLRKLKHSCSELVSKDLPQGSCVAQCTRWYL